MNACARSVNSFLTRLFENVHVGTHMRLPLTSVEKRVLQTYTPEEARKIITHKPQSRVGKRMMALLYLLIDTGALVSEALSLTRKNIDFDNLLVTLRGKGNKQRRAPISIECRKRLYHWLASHDHDLVFCAKGGGKLHYDNVRREFLVVLRAVKVEKTEGSFHIGQIFALCRASRAFRRVGAENDGVERWAFCWFRHRRFPETPRRVGARARPETPYRRRKFTHQAASERVTLCHPFGDTCLPVLN